MGTVALVRVGLLGGQGLSPQSSAVRPYGTYHDLRWLLVYHDSWLVFTLGLVGAILLRGVISAVLMGLAWPAEVSPLSAASLLRRNIGVTAFSAVIIAPFAALAVAASVVSLSWFIFASLIPMFLLAPFLQRLAVTAKGWHGLPPAELVGWSLLDFVVITVAGAVVWTAPEWWSLPVAAIVGAANGLLWNRTVRAAALPAHVRWPRLPVVPIVVVLALAIPIGAQALISTGYEARHTYNPPILTQPLPATVPYAVIVLAGHDSAYDGRASGDPSVERFSYAGLGPDRRPLPYRQVATHQSLEASAARLAAQVDAVHLRTGRPIALVGESEGAMVARTYLRNRPASPVRVLMMISPLVRTGRTYYPPPEASTGWGLAAGWLLRGIFTVTDLVGNTGLTPDEPFLRSLLDDGPYYRFNTMCPIPGVRVIAFLPTVSAAEAPPGQYTQIPTVEVPSFHGGFLGRPVVRDQLVDFLAGEDFNLPRAEYPVLQRLGAAWQAPTLSVTLNPVWRDQVSPGPAFTAARLCRG
ncbi:esterase/lipase family protein [Plantactinospora sp. GCM10030261]|uniref:esterase/lipase family protein n=1 Tax=Plantactinospora sp. GCM10030261 TaxID=3273420 RepID=UPI00360A1ADE